MLRSIAITASPLTRFFKAGILSLDLPVGTFSFPSAPDFSDMAAASPGATVAVIFVGRLLIRFCINGGILSNISFSCLSESVSSFSKSW